MADAPINLKDVDDIPPELLSELKEWRQSGQEFDVAMKLLAKHGLKATPSDISHWCSRVFRAPKPNLDGGEDRDASVLALEQTLSDGEIAAYVQTRRTLQALAKKNIAGKHPLVTAKEQADLLMKTVNIVSSVIKNRSEFEKLEAALRAGDKRALDKVAATYQVLAADDQEANEVMQRLAAKATDMVLPGHSSQTKDSDSQRETIN